VKKESLFTVFASIVTAILVSAAMIFIGLELLL
jgi:hypothetical protein